MTNYVIYDSLPCFGRSGTGLPVRCIPRVSWPPRWQAAVAGAEAHHAHAAVGLPRRPQERTCGRGSAVDKPFNSRVSGLGVYRHLRRMFSELLIIGIVQKPVFAYSVVFFF